ncbi:MAG: efflux RND transporter permease subunit [bacterium]
MRKIFEFSVRQRMFINLLTVFILAWGIAAMFSVKRDIFPNVNLDLVIVNASYPGSTPHEIEKLITIPIEKELKEVGDIKEMTSASIEGISTIVIEIEPDAESKDKVIDDIQRAVDRAEDLPADMKEKPAVIELKMKDHPVIQISIAGDLPEAELIGHARKLETKVLDIADVARVERMGWRDQEIWVEVDPDKADEMYVGINQVVAALKGQNVSIPGGSLIMGAHESLLRTSGEFDSAEGVKPVILRANELGHWVQVQDIAAVSDNFEPHRLLHRTDGHRAINLVAVKKERGDVLDVVKQIRDIVTAYQKSAPPGLKLSVVNDFSVYVRNRLDILESNGLVGISLVVVFLFLFMSWRSAIVTSIAIPASILATFIYMYYAGYTLNLMTMASLIIALGMLVDNAIVINDNFHRHFDSGVPAEEAAVRGAHEVWAPVFTSTLTTIAAFAPLMFMGGIIGKFTRFLPIVINIALIASLIEAFVVVPSNLVSLETFGNHEKYKWLAKGPLSGWFHRLTVKYAKVVDRLLRSRYRMIGAAALIFVLSIYIGVKVVPFVLFPQVGVDAFFIYVKAPVGTPLEETERRIVSIEQAVDRLPRGEWDDYVTQIGTNQQESNDLEGDQATHLGQIQVILKPEAARSMTADEIIEILRKDTASVEGFEEITFTKVRTGPPVGKPIMARIRNENLDLLDSIADELKSYLATIPGVSDIRDDYDRGKDEKRVIVDERQATRADLTVDDVALAVRASFDGAIATSIKRSDEEIDVRVRYPDAWRYMEGALERVKITNQEGDLIPITEVARFEETPGISGIRHVDRKRTVTVTGNVDEKRATSVGVTKKLMEKFKGIAEKHPDVSLKFGGEWQRTEESMHDLIFAVLVAVFLIFIILAFEFQSLMQPFIVMLSIIYGFSGVSLAFFLHGEPISFLALVGTVGLSGVVVNNAIVMIDFINKALSDGLPVHDAVVKAARLRIRPIFLTTVTTLLGILPMAYGIGGRDPFLIPMALSFGWGLIFSSMCTLFVTPCVYMVVDDLRCRLRHKIGLKGDRTCSGEGFDDQTDV